MISRRGRIGAIEAKISVIDKCVPEPRDRRIHDALMALGPHRREELRRRLICYYADLKAAGTFEEKLQVIAAYRAKAGQWESRLPPLPGNATIAAEAQGMDPRIRELQAAFEPARREEMLKQRKWIEKKLEPADDITEEGKERIIAILLKIFDDWNVLFPSSPAAEQRRRPPLIPPRNPSKDVT